MMKLKVVKKQNNAGGCFVCGTENPGGLHFDFFELENGLLAGVGKASPLHESYPGRVHGGVISALLDEAMGRAIQVSEPETWAVTASMEVKFLHPTPYDEPLLLVGEITLNNRRLFSALGKLYLQDGTLAAVSTGKYVKLSLEKIGGSYEEHGDKWELVENEKDPLEIEIPSER